MKIEIVLTIIFIHWVADFVCQPHEWSINKSKSWNALLKHTVSYSGIWFFITVFIFLFTKPAQDNSALLLFGPITFICHTATDYYTSRVNAKLWEDKDVHGFFVSIGFDQILHYIQLFLTYKFLTN